MIMVMGTIMTVSLSPLTTFAYSFSGKKWNNPLVYYSVNNIFAQSFQIAIRKAEQTWNNGGSGFRFSYTGTTDRNPDVWDINYRSDGYSDIGFSNRGDTGKIAGTRVSPDDSAIITEADVTLNIYYEFTTTGESEKYDLQDVLTHEFGHWLKLDDLYAQGPPSWCSLWVWESTMCYFIEPGETRKRDIEGDDKSGIEAIYGT